MKKSQLAVQLYTLRDYLKTAGGVDRAFARIREIGYEAVQVSGVAAPPSAVRKAAADNGLTICATHAAGGDILNAPEKVIEQLSFLNCRHTAFPCPEEWRLIDRGAVLEFASALEESARKLKAAGMTLSYHNHNLELMKCDGELILELIFAHAPGLLAEIDTYWIAMGGCDPAEWIAKYSGRQVLFHLKDFGVQPFTAVTETVGRGNLNWRRIIPAAEAAGCEWFIVEQDQCRRNPFDCLKDSFDYLVANFVR